MELIIEDKSDGILLVRFPKRVGYDNADKYFETIKDLFENRSQKIMFDFTDLVFLDSKGIGALIDIKRIADKNNYKVVYYNLTEPIHQLFKLSKLLSFFAVSIDEKQAMTEMLK